jgi:dipeptidyl aminopeptidase/acylaminoacyl peptidase
MVCWQKFGRWHRCGLVVLLVASLVEPAKAELPPLIPRKILFSDPQRAAVRISPDGKMLSYVAPSDKGVANVFVEDLSTQRARMVTRAAHRGIYDYAWAFDGKHLLYFSDENGNEDFHLYSVDLTNEEIRDLTPFAGTRAQQLLLSPVRPGQVLIGVNRRDRKVFDMYLVDLETGATTLDTANPGDVLSWTADPNFVIRAATAFTDHLDTVVRFRENAAASWRDVFVLPFEQAPFLGQVNGGNIIVDFSADGKKLVLGSSKNSPNCKLVELEGGAGKVSRVLAEEKDGDIAQVFADHFRTLIDLRSHQVHAVAFDDVKVQWHALDNGTQRDFEKLSQLESAVFNVEATDLSNERWIVSFARDNAATSFYFYDRKTQKPQFLFKDQPQLSDFTLAEMKPVTIRARDGFELLSYLTLPVGVSPKRLPLVLVVHGGPWARDDWGFDPNTQWLANRGYAVLQVNFRGSTVNETYMNAGNGKIGTGTDDDLTDAVQWAIAQEIADPRRIAVMGGSFGGYSTLRALTLHPDMYACGVEEVGPADMATLIHSIPDYWKPVKKRWLRRIGDVVADPQLNEKLSPLFHADAIAAPLLIGHGLNDPRVKIEQSEKIVNTIREKGGKVLFVVYPDEGHGFARPENNIDFAGRAEELLHEAVGGRFEPWQKVPGATGELK